MKKIILYSLVLLSISSCTKKTDVIESTTIVYQYVSPNYLIKEDFEMGKKTAYAIGDVAIKTGSWSFDDALLGQLAADIKKDSQSVRLRTGKISETSCPNKNLIKPAISLFLICFSSFKL